MAFDGERLVQYFFESRQTWQWDGVHWIQRQDIGPVLDPAAAMVGDTARKRCVLFGTGNRTHTTSETWVLSIKEG
jgi:hypothetical protein